MKDPRFPIANKVFPLIEQVVSLWRTLCFPYTIVDDMRVALGNMCLQMK